MFVLVYVCYLIFIVLGLFCGCFASFALLSFVWAFVVCLF